MRHLGVDRKNESGQSGARPFRDRMIATLDVATDWAWQPRILRKCFQRLLRPLRIESGVHCCLHAGFIKALVMMAFHRRVLPGSLVQPVIGRAFAIGPDAEQRSKGVERVKAAVKAEGKFVQVSLKVLGLDPPVMGALQPSLEVADNPVDGLHV